MTRVPIGIGLLVLILGTAACDGDGPPPSERKIRFDAAVAAWREGGEFERAGQGDAARESFFRAHRRSERQEGHGEDGRENAAGEGHSAEHSSSSSSKTKTTSGG